MKLGRFPGAAVALSAALLSAVAAAQSGAGNSGLNIPSDVQFVGQRDPNVRKATAIVNGEVITESDIDHRLALILASSQVPLPPEEVQRVRAQVLRNLIDETLQVQAAGLEEITVEDREIEQYFARVASGNNSRHETRSMPQGDSLTVPNVKDFHCLAFRRKVKAAVRKHAVTIH